MLEYSVRKVQGSTNDWRLTECTWPQQDHVSNPPRTKLNNWKEIKGFKTVSINPEKRNIDHLHIHSPRRSSSLANELWNVLDEKIATSFEIRRGDGKRFVRGSRWCQNVWLIAGSTSHRSTSCPHNVYQILTKFSQERGILEIRVHFYCLTLICYCLSLTCLLSYCIWSNINNLFIFFNIFPCRSLPIWVLVYNSQYVYNSRHANVIKFIFSTEERPEESAWLDMHAFPPAMLITRSRHIRSGFNAALPTQTAHYSNKIRHFTDVMYLKAAEKKVSSPS